jgi:putative flippase GtrA
MLIQFIKFGIVGFSNTVISYMIYSVLVYFGLHYIIASVAAFIVSVLNSFFWNDKYVFKRRSDEKRGFWGALLKTYVSYAFTGLVLNSILLSVFIEILRVDKFIAPLLGLAVTIPLNFVLNRKWAFKNKS